MSYLPQVEALNVTARYRGGSTGVAAASERQVLRCGRFVMLSVECIVSVLCSCLVVVVCQ